ncbi:hypothetical protein B0H17DRAFT_72660 [Mycena rosella]|uniref:Uncharacterized protein n=1 Tax=Mycena rosella TaxID=1033263 RepID=A0AAD7AYX5_MYCRO|nr:hypothetical protein B0H17DRAFT_72660 [Mycena rosella]
MSELKCPKCLKKIPVGTGGQANLDTNHVDSRDCLEAVRPAALSKKPKPIFGSRLNIFYIQLRMGTDRLEEIFGSAQILIAHAAEAENKD